MAARRTQRGRVTGACVLALGLAAACAAGMQTGSPPAGLSERQRAIKDRVERLENRMLELSRLLAESQPEKAERLRDTLDLAGRRRVRLKIERLIELLDERQLSAADQRQGELIADLTALMELLTSSLNELDRLREQRERLEALQRQISEMIDEQRRLLYQTQRAAAEAQREQGEPEPALPEASPSRESAQAESLRSQIRRLEELQRRLERGAAQVAGEMMPGAGRPETAPGQDAMEQAGQRMRAAGDQLGRQSPDSAQREQHEAINQMQQAVDELEESLRQLRQEEREETLAALETRLQALLDQERRVREAVAALQQRQAAQQWTRLEELQASEAHTLQRETTDEARATLRILLDEGTTVVVPELMRQLVEDMESVVIRLERSDVSAFTTGVLDDIIAQLEEILAAVERQRDADAEAPPPQAQPQNRDGSQPLLARSAELRLLRGSQVRINERTDEVAATTDAPRGETEALAQRLAERQERLAEQARRMYRAP